MDGFNIFITLKRGKETAMYTEKDIILAVDYHDKNMVIRWFNCHTGEENILKVETTNLTILGLIDKAVSEASRVGGRVIWIMESTTGWARVKDLIGDKVSVRVANVLQMPLPPKAYRRKTDKVDTGRMLREFLNNTLPYAHQAPISIRQIRRLVAAREDLVSRRTALRNWIDRFLAHEAWIPRTGLWSGKGMIRLQQFISSLPEPDQTVLSLKQAELEQLETWLSSIQKKMIAICHRW
ncbi:MAG: transposase [Sedimentisphaerales bacterium]|nr:transposase [Sedimentisphaerales bacterium]